ncbi:hypothetical protein V6N13_108545 [Hibiscus sabdariffa]|uniref:Uncharacterized protein n=1 Tax=Hibiscus sabdariffa TaxID=183260 RepID=A0ABR2SST0_9ROSI
MPEPAQSVQSIPHESSPFGPWMGVERRQRRAIKKQTDSRVDTLNSPIVASRFNPIFEDDVRDQAAFGDVTAPPQTTPLISKGKKPVPQSAKAPKHKSATSVRKPITVIHNASKLRLASHASSSRSTPAIPHISKPPNRSNHSVVVISENDEPSMATLQMQHNPMQHDVIPHQQHSTDPPNINGGCIHPSNPSMTPVECMVISFDQEVVSTPTTSV